MSCCWVGCAGAGDASGSGTSMPQKVLGHALPEMSWLPKIFGKRFSRNLLRLRVRSALLPLLIGSFTVMSSLCARRMWTSRVPARCWR